MSYEYSDADQHEALYNVARRYPGGGIVALAAALSQRLAKRITVPVLRNKLRPGINTHHITFEDLSLIIELCQEANMPDATMPLEALCWRHGLVPVALPRAGEDLGDPAQAVIRVMKEIGDVATAVTKAADDGVITEAELDDIEREFIEAQAAIAAWRADIQRRAEKSRRKASA
ncbi:phage regulatory CII family protein [Cupriavidus plantarum]|uniref:phage regulatory CII family protein n=1 Tax=Cupriavidus plantarum TaxID=942865 RepID=UPI000EAB6DE8|nr:phage regulatory CII family protein [Cupriavidus plantarum]RLK45964.1 hypothetical protein C7417_1995 [Cupriavidus plantarum]